MDKKKDKKPAIPQEHWEKRYIRNVDYNTNKMMGYQYDAQPAKERVVTYKKVNETDY